MTKKKTTQMIKSNSAALATLPPAVLIPMLGSKRSVAKLSGAGGEVVREDGVTLITGRSYATSDRIIPATEIYFVDGAKLTRDGPWLGEADKVSWRDEATGLECIMLRATKAGYLSGYVGIPSDHPLWGWHHEAIPADFGIEVHGGLTYSRICDEGPAPTRQVVIEAHSICHAPRTPLRYEPLSHATDHLPQDAHAWWFGFDCNHIYDIVPGETSYQDRFLSAETGAVYRDDAYVVDEILNLAGQLRAIAEGEQPPARVGKLLPPLGLDPQEGC